MFLRSRSKLVFLTTFITLLSTHASLSRCFFCEKQVVFSKSLSECYAARYNKLLDEVKNQPDKLVLVNLADCPIPENEEHLRNAHSFTDPGNIRTTILTIQFLADEDILNCLHGFLERSPITEEATRKIVFDIECEQ